MIDKETNWVDKVQTEPLHQGIAVQMHRCLHIFRDTMDSVFTPIPLELLWAIKVTELPINQLSWSGCCTVTAHTSDIFIKQSMVTRMK